jgi:hypothetical protein
MYDEMKRSNETKRRCTSDIYSAKSQGLAQLLAHDRHYVMECLAHA